MHQRGLESQSSEKSRLHGGVACVSYGVRVLGEGEAVVGAYTRSYLIANGKQIRCGAKEAQKHFHGMHATILVVCLGAALRCSGSQPCSTEK